MRPLDQTPIPMDADTQAVLDALTTGRRLDPEIAERLRKELDDLRAQVLRKHGVLDIGVPAIRELRGELPNP